MDSDRSKEWGKGVCLLSGGGTSGLRPPMPELNEPDSDAKRVTSARRTNVDGSGTRSVRDARDEGGAALAWCADADAPQSARRRQRRRHRVPAQRKAGRTRPPRLLGARVADARVEGDGRR